MKYMRWIANFWKPHRPWVWILTVLTIISSAATLVYPYFIGFIIDKIYEFDGKAGIDTGKMPDFIQGPILALNNWVGTASAENAAEIGHKLILVILLVGLARTLSSLYPGVRALINAKLAMDIRKYYFSKIIDKGYQFYNKLRTGDLVTRLTDDIDGWPKIAWFCCSGIFRAVESTSKFIFCIAFMCLINWKLALISISPLPLMLWIYYALRIKLTKVALARQQMISNTNDQIEAATSGVRILKAFNGIEGQSKAFKKVLENRIDIEIQFQKLWFSVWNVYAAITKIGQLIVIFVGMLMVWGKIPGALTVGELYAFYIYIDYLLGPLMDIPQLFVTSRTAFACIDREIEIEETPGGIENYIVGKTIIPRINAVELENVTFRYAEGLPPTLENISLTLKHGEKAAVIGSVGCGKTTLIKVVSGMFPPEIGVVKVNDVPMNAVEIRSYREKVGYIPQESTLFSETVEDNVKFGRDVSDGVVRESLDMAQVLEEMEKLPSGLKEVLGQKGLTVSGGQKQRLAIARAIACDPDLLLMDDCTSSLDAENEKRFWDMFAKKYPDTACLIVTHRLSTARKADIIYVLDEGRIVGKGTHEELLRDCEEYRNFLTREELKAALKAG